MKTGASFAAASVRTNSPVCAASVLPEPCTKRTAGEGPGPAGLQRSALRRSVPLGTTTVSGARDTDDWPSASNDSMQAHATRMLVLIGHELYQTDTAAATRDSAAFIRNPASHPAPPL